jgi:hypothetical protein
MSVDTTRDLYREINHLKRDLRLAGEGLQEAIAELNASRRDIDDLEARVRQRDGVIEKMKGDMKNMGAVLDIMAAANPALYHQAAKDHNLM